MATEMDGNEVSADQRSTYNERKLARWPFARGPCLLQSAALALANAVAQVNSQPRLIVVANDCIAAVVTLPSVRTPVLVIFQNVRDTRIINAR
jgi:hypothetical protein